MDSLWKPRPLRTRPSLFLLATLKYSPSSSRTRTSTSVLLSEPSNASPFFSDDELAVLSKGVVACISSVLFTLAASLLYTMSSGYS